MSRPRALSETKTPHSVSLKVLRLTAPHLSQQYTLPPNTSSSTAIPPFDPRAALAYTPSLPASPHTKSETKTNTEPENERKSKQALSAHDTFILSPVLTLPPAFGPAYVGETFSCTLVASDEPVLEMPSGEGEQFIVQDVKITAEMGTPGAPSNETVTLDVTGPIAHSSGDGTSPEEDSEAPDEKEDMNEEDEINGEKKPRLVQRIIRHGLLEEGTHVLAVTVTYNEVRRASNGEILGNRVRTFRKLYQFAAKPLLGISTKARKTLVRSPREEGRYVLEAQLENGADATIVLEEAELRGAEGGEVFNMNSWRGNADGPILRKGDVVQVCYVIGGVKAGEDGAVDLGRLGIRWRNVMGEKGRLSTGLLRHVVDVESS